MENGVVWGSWGHSKSLETAPFNRAHTSSFESSILTMSCIVSEIQRDIV